MCTRPAYGGFLGRRGIVLGNDDKDKGATGVGVKLLMQFLSEWSK